MRRLLTSANAAMLLVIPAAVVASAQPRSHKLDQRPLRAPAITVTDLGTFAEDHYQTIGLAINNAGSIVGVSDGPDGRVSFYWSARTGFINILGDRFGQPNDINNRGEVAGSHEAGGFLWDVKTRTLQDLGPFGPIAINDRGEMAGGCPLSDGSSVPCVYIDGEIIRVPVEDVGGWAGQVFGINQKGVVVGLFYSTEGYRGFTWSERDGIVVLPVPCGVVDGAAAGINDGGIVCGAVGSNEVGLWSAAFWFRDRLIHVTSEAKPSLGCNAINAQAWTIRDYHELWIVVSGNWTPSPLVTESEYLSLGACWRMGRCERTLRAAELRPIVRQNAPAPRSASAFEAKAVRQGCHRIGDQAVTVLDEQMAEIRQARFGAVRRPVQPRVGIGRRRQMLI